MKTMKISNFFKFLFCFAFVFVSLFFIHTTNVVSASANVKITTIYNGSVDEGDFVTTTINDIDLTVVGFGTSKKTGTYIYEDTTYSNLILTGGRSSDTRYIKFNVPEKYDSISVRVVFCSNGSSVRSVGISENGPIFDENGIVFDSANSSEILVCGVTDRLKCGEYYITFNESVRLAEININCFEKNNDIGGASQSDYFRYLTAVTGVCLLIFVCYLLFKFIKTKVKL